MGVQVVGVKGAGSPPDRGAWRGHSAGETRRMEKLHCPV